MSSCLPTLAPSDTKNFIWSILSRLSRMMIFPPPPVLSQKQTKHQKNNPLEVGTEKSRPLEASPPILGIENSSGPGLQRDFLHRPEPVKQHDARRFHCFFFAWFGKKKSGQQSNKGRTSIFYTIKKTHSKCYLPFEREGMSWGFPRHFLFSFKASKGCLLQLQRRLGSPCYLRLWCRGGVAYAYDVLLRNTCCTLPRA